MEEDELKKHQLLQYMKWKRDEARDHGEVTCEPFELWDIDQIVVALEKHFGK